MGYLQLISVLFVLGSLGLVGAKPQDQTKLCFFIDGKAICGEEGVRAQVNILYNNNYYNLYNII